MTLATVGSRSKRLDGTWYSKSYAVQASKYAPYESLFVVPAWAYLLQLCLAQAVMDEEAHVLLVRRLFASLDNPLRRLDS